MKKLTGDAIELNFITKANEKARIRNIKVNGKKATAVFSEYIAPNELKEEFRKYNGSDGHMFFITFFIWNGARSYYTNKEISTSYEYLTTKEEGNKIYKQIKTTGKKSLDLDD